MSSIASVGSGTFQSPLSRLKAELTSEVSTGAVQSTDETALSGALDDIDSSLKPDSSSGSSSASQSSPPDPSDIKTKISSLIDTEVSSGKLTSDQATELKQIFSNASPTGGAGGAGGPGGGGGGPGGPGGAGGPPPGPPPGGGGSSASDSSSSSDTSSSSTTSTTTSATDLLNDFLKTLQASQSNTYSADGASATNASSSLLLSYTA